MAQVPATVTTKDKLMDAVLDVVRETGYKYASTKKIAERAGVNEASVFRLFGSKKQLFWDAVYHRTISMKYFDLDSVMSKDTFPERLTAFVDESVRLYIKQMAIYRIFVLAVEEVDIDHQMTVFSRVQGIIDAFAQFLADEHEAGNIARADYQVLSEVLFSRILIVALELTSNHMDGDEQRRRAGEFSREYCDFFCKRFLVA